MSFSPRDNIFADVASFLVTSKEGSMRFSQRVMIPDVLAAEYVVATTEHSADFVAVCLRCRHYLF